MAASIASRSWLGASRSTSDAAGTAVPYAFFKPVSLKLLRPAPIAAIVCGSV
jgi:hypothetical protein